MKPHTSFWWLGWLALLTSSTYGQGSDSASHDLRIFIVEAEPSGSGMGGMGLGGTYDPAHPTDAGKLVLRIVNNSRRDLTMNPKHMRVYAYAGRYAPPYLQGAAFLHEGDVTVPAGKSLDVLRVPLSDILDPARLNAQRTITWNWGIGQNAPYRPPHQSC